MVEGYVEWGRRRRSNDYPWLFHIKPKIGGVVTDAIAIDSPGARKVAATIAESKPRKIQVKYKILDEKKPIKIKIL